MLMQTDYEVSKPTFRHIESYWYKYPKLVQEIERIKYNEIKKGSVDENIGGGRSGRISDPTAAAATRITTHKRIEHIEEIVHAIETVYNMANEEYRKLIRTRYWSSKRLDWEMISSEAGFSVRQCQRVRKILVVATAEILGW